MRSPDQWLNRIGMDGGFGSEALAPLVRNTHRGQRTGQDNTDSHGLRGLCLTRLTAVLPALGFQMAAIHCSRDEVSTTETNCSQTSGCAFFKNFTTLVFSSILAR